MRAVDRPIVIIGGMGPQASSTLYKLLIEKAIGSKGVQSNEDFPHIIIDSLASPDFISSRRRQHEAIATLQQAVQRALKLEPTAVCIACNTAHLFAAEAGVKGRKEFISLIDVVARQVNQSNIKVVGLLASPTTIKTKLYKNALAELGVECIVADTSGQNKTEEVIRAVMAGVAGKKETEVLELVTSDLLAKGAEGVILGCTELPLVFNDLKTKFKVFDCLDLLADKLLDNYYKEIGYNENR